MNIMFYTIIIEIIYSNFDIRDDIIYFNILSTIERKHMKS